MAKEFFKNTADAFKVLFQETREAGKRFAQSEPAQKVAAEVKETIQELESSPIGTRIQGAVEKVGDEISHQVKKLYKVCPTCGRKMASGDNYCASCGNPLPKEPTIWDEAETAEPAAAEESVQESDFADTPAAEEEPEAAVEE